MNPFVIVGSILGGLFLISKIKPSQKSKEELEKKEVRTTFKGQEIFIPQSKADREALAINAMQTAEKMAKAVQENDPNFSINDVRKQTQYAEHLVKLAKEEIVPDMNVNSDIKPGSNLDTTKDNAVFAFDSGSFQKVKAKQAKTIKPTANF